MASDRKAIEDALPLHVDRLAGLIGPRIYEKPESIEAAMSYIRNQWAEMAYNVTEEPFDALGVTAKNLIVQQKGSKKPERLLG